MIRVVTLGLGAVFFSAAAYADTPPKNLITMEGDDDIIQISSVKDKANKAHRPKRTHFFSGMEIENTVYDNQPKRSSTRYILADGSTRLHKNFRLRFLLSETHNKQGDPEYKRGDQINYTIAPRYEKWVSPKFSFFAEPVFVRKVVADGAENQEIKLKPGAQFTIGKHFLNTTAEYKMIKRKRYKTDVNGWNPEVVEDAEYDAFNAEVNYTYRFSPKFNFGLGSVVNGSIDNSDYLNRFKEYNIKPFVRLRHWNNITTELNFRIGRTERGEFWSGHDYVDVNLNNNMPINRNMRLVANFGYRNGEEHTSTKHSWGDREGIFARVGFNFSF